MTSRARCRPSAASAVPVLLLLVTAGWYLLPRGLPRDLVVVLADVVVVGALLAGARRLPAPQRRAWVALAVGQALNAAAWTVWMLVPLLTGEPAGAPGLGDLLFVSSYAVNVLVLARLSRAAGADRASVLDAAVLATAFGVVLWVTVAAPQATAPGVTLLVRAVSVAYPLLDVLLLAAAAPLVLSRSRTPRALLLVGFVLLQLAGDVVFGRQVVAGTFAYGTPVFGFWLLSFASLAAAALHPSPIGTVRPAPWWRRAVLTVGLLPLPALLVVRLVQGSGDQVVLVGVATLVVTLLAVARAAPSHDLPAGVEREVRRALAVRAAGLVVLALLPLVSLTALAVGGARATVEEDVARRLDTAAMTSSSHVQEQLGVLRTLVSAYADRPAVVEAAAAGDPAGADVVARHLSELEARSPAHVGAWFLDASGRMRAFSPAQPGLVGRDFSYRDYYLSLLGERRTHVSEAFVAALPGQPRVIAVSARVERDGRLLGVVALGYRVDAFAAFVERLATAQGADITLTDGRGTVLAGEDLPATGLLRATDREVVAAALRGRSGLVRPQEEETGTWTAYAPLPELGWAVVAEVDGAVAYASAQRLSGRLVAAATLLGQVLLAGLLLQVGGERRRRVAEARLAGREAEVTEILAEAGDAFLSLDAQGRVLRWNRRAEELFGWRAAEAVGLSAADLVLPEPERASFRACLARAARRPAAGGARTSERELQRRDGTCFPADTVVWSTLVDGEPVLNAFVRDITERREHEAALGSARDQALRASRLKSEFVANMSHEIRTPMNGVVGMTTLLLDTPLDDRQREFVETLRGSADALLAVLNDVLDFSKIEAGKLDLEDADVPVRGLLEDVVELLAASASVKGLDIAAVVDPALPSRLRTDGHRLRQVLTNLVGNAVKFTDAGEVVLQAAAAGPAVDGRQPVRFSVRDTGAGICAERQQQLFEAFTQADASTTRRHGGTGLGLTISRQLVRLLGGELDVHSTPQEGSTFGFTLVLPVVEGEAPEPAADLRGVRVLVADDSATNRTVLEHLLVRWSAETVSVDDGDAALRALQTASQEGRPFGVALLDARMPGLDGLEVAAAVAADPSLDGVRVVLLSSADEEGEAGAPGIDARLTKPVRERALRRAVLETVPAGAVPAPRPAPAPRAAPARRGRVLVAEDGLVNQVVVVEMLAMLGVDADVAADGEEALRLLQRGGYDAVLMDCQMPVLDGYDATRRLRALAPPLCRTPVVALTASALTSDRLLCEEAGMDDFLAKPLRLDELEAVLARTLGARTAAGPSSH